MVEDFSPEERLLRLIRGKHKDAPDSKETSTPNEGKQASPAAEEKPSAPAKIIIPRRSALNPYTTYLYIALIVAVLALLGVFAFSLLSNREEAELQDLRKMIVELSEKEEKPSSQEGEEVVKKTGADKETQESSKELSFEEYQRLIETKSLFAPPVQESGVVSIPSGPSLRELVNTLRLVGIIPGDEPQAIIEDKSSGQTFFLREADNIGDIEVRKISSGRVILGRGDETISLSL